MPAAALLAPIIVPSIAPPSISTDPNIPTLVIFGCAGVASVPVILALAVNVVKVPAAALLAPIIVPSIAPLPIFTLLLKLASPLTINELLISTFSESNTK